MERIDDPDTEPTRLPTRLQVLRHHLRRLGAAVLPTVTVIGLYLGLFFLDFLTGTDLAVFGVKDAATEQRVFARYGRLIATEQAHILLTFLGVGLCVGVVAQALTVLWERSGAWPRTPRGYAGVPAPSPSEDRWSLGRRLIMTLVLALAFHLWQLCHAIARFPQLFSEVLYDRGGLRRSLMVALTLYIPSSLVDGLALGALAGLMLGPALTPRGRSFLRGLLPATVRRMVSGPPSLHRASMAAGMLLLLFCAFLSFRPAEQQAKAAATAPSAGHRPSVLMIAVDSLRADRVGPWARTIAPNIAALSDRSVRFDSAFVTVPRTFPSFVTILTGRYPHHHGIRTMFPSASERSAVGPALPGLLIQTGFSTHALSDFCGEIFSRVDLGFGDVRVPYFDVKTIVRQRSVTIHPNLLPYVDGRLGRRIFPSLEALAELSDPDLLADRVIAALSDHQEKRAGQPFFMTVFFSTAHFPYAAPAPYYRRFADPHYRGPFRYAKQPLMDASMTPADEQQVRALYDGAVAATDAAIGRLLHALEQQGLDKDTIVVLLADHGENLYDEPGRGMGHGDHLEGSHSLQIPLLLYDPVHRFHPHAVPGIVRDIDLVPTLLQLLSVSPGEMPLDGTSLLPLLSGDKQSLGLHSFSETELWFTTAGPGFEPDDRLPYPGVTATTDIDPQDDIFVSDRWRNYVTVAKHRSLRTDRWKIIYRPTRSGVHWTLYDVLFDRNETRDVAALHPQELAMLQAELFRFLADDPRAVVEGGYVIPR